MEQLDTRRFAGIDLSHGSAQLSIYDEGSRQMTEESFLLPEDDREDYIRTGMDLIVKHMKTERLKWEDFQSVYFSLEDASTGMREHLAQVLPVAFKDRHGVRIITRFRAFAEYVFHQERVVWDRNTLLLDYTDDTLSYIPIDQIRRSKQKAYRATRKELDLTEYEVERTAPDRDQKFSKMMRKFLVKNPANIIFLTGDGFEGNWMKKTLTYLCAGRRVFLGKNLYANGACLLGTGSMPLMDEGMILMDGPDMVSHTIGVITSEAGKAKYVPVTSIGREWYNTEGSIDIILDKNQRVEFFFHNTIENEIEGATCEIRDLPSRPPKTTRIRVEVIFSSQTEGTILMTDLGFGSMFPATEKITVFPFKLIS